MKKKKVCTRSVASERGRCQYGFLRSKDQKSETPGTNVKGQFVQILRDCLFWKCCLKVELNRAEGQFGLLGPHDQMGGELLPLLKLTRQPHLTQE